MRKFEDFTGRTYGRLTVIRPVKTPKRTKWECKCECGKTKIVNGSDLKRGDTTSCGCLHLEQLIERSTKHGFAHHRLYNIYHGIITRCENKRDAAYRNYGGRGIKICDEWKNDFMAFYEWSINNGYSDNLSIDRIDNNGDYSPQNCRWATPQQQGNNTRTNKLVTFNGETHTLAEWSRITGINYNKLQNRIARGWPIEEVFGAPHRKTSSDFRRSKTIAYKNGEMVGVFDSQRLAAEKLGVRASKISACVNGLRPHTCGYTFKRYEEVENE